MAYLYTLGFPDGGLRLVWAIICFVLAFGISSAIKTKIGQLLDQEIEHSHNKTLSLLPPLLTPLFTLVFLLVVAVVLKYMGKELIVLPPLCQASLLWLLIAFVETVMQSRFKTWVFAIILTPLFLLNILKNLGLFEF